MSCVAYYNRKAGPIHILTIIHISITIIRIRIPATKDHYVHCLDLSQLVAKKVPGGWFWLLARGPLNSCSSNFTAYYSPLTFYH